MFSRTVRLATVVAAAIVVAGVGVAAAGGGTISDKLRTGDNISVAAGEVVGHDLYAFGGDIVIDGTIEGDLVAGGGSVTVNGSVEGDVVAGAGLVSVNGSVDGDLVTGSGRVVISGDVQGDARIGSGTVTVSGAIGEDLLAGAGRIDIDETGEVGEDLMFGAGDVLVAGSVEGSVFGRASSYSRTGTVGGDEDVTLETGFPYGPYEPEPSEPAPNEPERIAGDAIRHLVTVLVFGALALLLLPGPLRASESTLRRRPLASAGIGVGILVGYIIQFIAVILLAILLALAFGSVTLDALAGISVWVAILDLMITTFALIVGAAFIVDLVVGLALGQLVARGWAQNRWQEFALLAGGALVVVALSSIPGIGFLVKLVVIVLGFGAMAVAFAEWWQRRRPPAGPAYGSVPSGMPPVVPVPTPTPSAAPPAAPPAPPTSEAVAEPPTSEAAAAPPKRAPRRRASQPAAEPGGPPASDEPST